MTRKLSFQERLLLAAQKDGDLATDSYPARHEFERRFRELNIPETTESTARVTVESLVATNLHDFMNPKPE